MRERRTRCGGPPGTRDISTSAGKVGPFVMSAIVPSDAVRTQRRVETGQDPATFRMGQLTPHGRNSGSGPSDSLSGTGSGPGHLTHEPGAPACPLQRSRPAVTVRPYCPP
ncbi:hypothetical protein GCM10010217_44080 [Streptomyces tubercidicus]